MVVEHCAAAQEVLGEQSAGLQDVTVARELVGCSADLCTVLCAASLQFDRDDFADHRHG